MSAAEPGPNPMTILIGWTGKTCAKAEALTVAASAVIPAQKMTILRKRLNMVPPAVHSSARRWPSTSLTPLSVSPTAWASLVRDQNRLQATLYRDQGQKEATMQSDPQRRARGTQKLGEIL